jgi:hypothetical protein
MTARAGRLRLVLDKAVVAYRKPLDRPFFTVSLRDAAGRLLEPPQDTPPGHFQKAERCIAAGHAVVLRTPLQDLPGGAVSNLPPLTRLEGKALRPPAHWHSMQGRQAAC